MDWDRTSKGFTPHKICWINFWKTRRDSIKSSIFWGRVEVRLDKKGPWGPICGDGWGVPEAIVSHITDFSLSCFQFFLLLFYTAGANFEIYVFVGNKDIFKRHRFFVKCILIHLKAILTQFLFDLLLLDSRPPRFKSRRSYTWTMSAKLGIFCIFYHLCTMMPNWNAFNARQGWCSCLMNLTFRRIFFCTMKYLCTFLLQYHPKILPFSKVC